MEEELDYMSDEFISKCSGSNSDVRPGLLKTHNEQREHNLMKRKKLDLENKQKPAEVLQAEKREESLKQPINSANKGFSMLEKMGFKSGMGLGKNSTGIVEPIGINMKNDRKGLGHKKPKNNTKKSETNIEKISESDYRAFLSKKNKERENLSDLKRSQRICWELDLKCGKSEAEEVWFWPEETVEVEENDIVDKDSSVDELTTEEKLEMLTKYLRDNYWYCIWCKVQYENEEDMEDCPGATRDDH